MPTDVGVGWAGGFGSLVLDLGNDNYREEVKSMKRKTNGQTTKAVAVRTSREIALPADLQEEFSAYLVKDLASARAAGWSFIGTRGAKFRMGQEELGEELQVVVLGAMRENVYYEGKFDQDNPTGPVCFALDTAYDEATMAPPAELKTKQHPTCVGCEQNAWGSSDVGRGKACKNTVRLVLLNWCDGDLAQLEKSEGARLRVPVTSVKDWSSYVAKIDKGARRPIFTALTKIGIHPDPKTNMKMTFALDSFINDRAALQVLKRRADEAVEHLIQIQMPAEGEPRKTEAKGAGKTKGLVRRKVTRTRATARR